jgi:predicted transcriptional regulator
MTKLLEEVISKVRELPEAEQDMAAAELMRYLEAELGGAVYHATPEELAGIDRGLLAASEGRFATDHQVEEAFSKFRPA